ncbi:MAG: DUF1566 domain-containing protein [Deltaproteobacteria bacterium]|nr:DUF1566 domain-containing protein [Deltaproteobacteria bacterium]
MPDGSVSPDAATQADAGPCSGPRPASSDWTHWPTIPLSPPLSAYVINDLTVLDTQTCLMWQRGVTGGTGNWATARAYCDQLELAGFSDWRLPTETELLTILDRSRRSPAINITAFPDTPATVDHNWYWSATPNARDPTGYAWIVGFLNGVSSPCDVGSAELVRCVR